MQTTLKRVFDGLKKIKNNVTNVFDNSMIIVFGDHSSHQNNNGDHHESAMMIKYPEDNNSNAQTSIKVVSDKVVYAPYINDIILEYFKNRTKLGQLFNNSNKFSQPNKEWPIFISNTKMAFATWDNEHLNYDEKKIVTYQDYRKYKSNTLNDQNKKDMITKMEGMY